MKNIKIAWGICGVLTCIVLALVIYIISTSSASELKQTSAKGTTESKVVATIGEEAIHQEEWLEELKTLYGREVLEEMINREVIRQLALETNLIISDDEMEREMEFFKRQLQLSGESNHIPTSTLKEEIKYSILFEEMITKDIVIDEPSMLAFYKENQYMYNLNKQYHLSHILVNTLEDANQVIDELEGNASFDTLAMEWSTDIYTRTNGGDLGWVEEGNHYLPKEYIDAIENMEEEQYSKPIKVDEGYAIVYLQEIFNEKQYEFEEVKSQIRRQLAINQLEDTLSPLEFWDNINVEWLYETK